MKNQCDGCVAEIPIENGKHRMEGMRRGDGTLSPYPNWMICQKDKYETEEVIVVEKPKEAPRRCKCGRIAIEGVLFCEDHAPLLPPRWKKEPEKVGDVRI